MGWFTKKTSQSVQPIKSKDAIEDEMMRLLAAIPLSRWDETIGGFAALSDAGTTIELKYWRLSAGDGSFDSNCSLHIDGELVPVDKRKIERLYQNLSQRLSAVR